MANLELKPKEKTHKKKRKLRSDEEERPSKTSHVQLSVEETKGRETSQQLEDDGPPWRNLQLVLTLQNKDIDLQKKVQVASDYVKLKVNEEKDGSSQGSETVSDSRVIVFLNNWIQSLFISSEKKIRAERYKPQLEITGSCLDHRCWKIFKFCLEESLKLHVSLSFSRDFLRVVHCILRDLLYRLSAAPPHSEDSLLSDEVFELYGIVLGCTSLVFLSHGGVSNDNLDLWVLTVEAVIELVRKVLIDKLDGSKMGVFVLQISCYLLEPFAKFLRVHPVRKNGFHDFVDKLLEHMLCLLDVLHLHVHGNKTERTRNLLKLVEEVLCQGLFHPTHIDGFLSLQSRLKYIASDDGIPKDLTTVIKSYHRHLFEKLEKIIAGKNVLALGGIGELFHLFVDCIKKQKGVSENSQCLSNVNAETRKSMFDFFIQIMEPLLLEANAYLQAELEVWPSLMDVRCTLRSINKILASFLHHKIYIRTDDNSAGYCLNFLKVVYVMVMSYSPRINQLWSSTFDLDKGIDTELLKLVAKELIILVRFLLEIEYEVVGNDLERLWLMTFSYGALGLSLIGGPEQCSLAEEILQLGCQLINLYGELRQVNNAIFALCKAVRRVVLPDSESQLCCSKPISPISSMHFESFEKSVRLLLCSQEFSLAFCNAIKSIPEGQASGCIRQITTDISESMEWMKVKSSFTAENEIEKRDQRTCNKPYFNLQAELLGKGLSELYTLVLESLTVTTGNSNLIGVAVKDLMVVICPYMSALVALRPDCVDEFLSTVTGRTFNQGTQSKSDFLSSYWVVLFFFRLYMSCRSLYRQAISLVSPDISKKMSGLLGDSLTAYSGRDWLERTDWTDEGYFSWIVQPSASLLTVIQAISDIYLQETVVDCSPLIYALNAMALQRLVDLNRLIKSFEYILLRNDHLVPKKSMDDARISLHHRKTRKWKSYVSDFRQEAAGLTNFMMGYLPLVAKITSNDVTYKHVSARALHENDAWSFSVGAVNEKSLPSAFWWIVCRNIDVWCTHAAKKNLKMFLLLLIQTSLPSVESSLDGYGEHSSSKPGHLNEVTVHQISLELLSNTVLYEQRFVRRYMASRFCRTLEKSILHIFRDFKEVDLNSSPNWPEFLSALDNSTKAVSSYKHVMNGCSSAAETISQPFDTLPDGCCKDKKISPLIGEEFTACQRLLNLLCWMPKGFLNSRSFSLYGTCILNLERLVVGSLLGCHGALWLFNHYELFRLLVSCRRTLKYLLMASREEKVEASQSSLAQLLSESSFPILWLLKSLSAVIGLQHSFSEDHASQVRNMIFSLTDHTSYVFLTLSKDQSIHAVHFLKNAGKPNEEQPNSDVVHEHSGSIKINPCLDSSTSNDSWKILVLIADTLKEETRKLHLSLKEAICDRKVEGCVDVLELRRLSAIISCFQGFLWGLASAFDHVDANGCNIRSKLSRWKFEPIYQVNFCIDVFADFVNYFLHVLLLEDDQLPQSLCGTQTFATAINTSTSSDIKGDSNKSGRKRKSHVQNLDAESILNKVDLFEQQNLNKSLLQGFLRGENPEASFFLRQLFITSSAILRLNLQMNFTSLSSSLVPIFIGISEVLLLEFANKVEAPQPFSFVWLDGVIKFLEELGSHFPLTNPISSRSMYVKIIDLHLRAIGKCISLQGKGATLASHETESSTKTLNSQMGLSESTLSHKPYCLDEFKGRLRTSFKVFVNKSSELHLLSAIQALERALIGVEEGCTMVYNIYVGGSDGGKVSSIVAAAVDCLDSILEFVTGHKRLSLVKRHIQSLVSCLFNIVLHLQGPAIFYRNVVNPNKGDSEPDPGSVILMCVEVLTRVFGKHALYQMDSFHVGQSLRIAAALFQNFLHLRLSHPSVVSISTRFSDTHNTESIESIESTVVDRQFTVDLYAASCRLLCTVLKHHKSECERSIALLENSACVLLHCLEIADVDPVVRKDYFAWEVQEGVKCAGFLRRIYEEMRQQKDVYGRHCFLFLSNYIWIYSGFGPLKTGIKRELDEALRPGVYALIDACSAEDLQHLHTVFGEGPCRSTLATLQHDYKQNFQYEGKV